MTHPTYIREREGDRELEATCYCLPDAIRNVGDRLRHEQRGSTRALPAPNDPAPGMVSKPPTSLWSTEV
eukprot:2969163-Amphidinium_carterae.1